MTPEVKQRIEQIRCGEVPEGYKKTALGVVPAHWIETTLGEIYTERNEPGNDDLPLLMVSIHSGVSDGEVDEEDLPKKVKRIEDKSQYKHALPGDLVFNMMRAWQGAIGSVRTEGMVSPAYIVAKPNDMVDPIFMDYYMKMPRMISMIHRQSYGVTDFRLRLYWDSFSPIPCVLPPIEEQRRIAEILSVQDAHISLQLKKLAAYQHLKKTFLGKMLPKGGSNEPELRFGGFTDAWEQRKFSDLAQRESTFCASSSGLPGVEYEDVVAGEGRLNKDIRLKEVQKTGIIFDGTQVLYGKLRPYLHNWLSPDFQGVAIGDWWVLRPIGIDKNFLFRLIQTKQFDEVANQSSGSKMPRADWNLVSNTDFSIPSSLDEQKQIAASFEELDTLITLHQRKVDFTQTKKDVLMQLLLTGLVTVKRRNHGLLI